MKTSPSLARSQHVVNVDIDEIPCSAKWCFGGVVRKARYSGSRGVRGESGAKAFNFAQRVDAPVALGRFRTGDGDT